MTGVFSVRLFICMEFTIPEDVEEMTELSEGAGAKGILCGVERTVEFADDVNETELAFELLNNDNDDEFPLLDKLTDVLWSMELA